MAPVSKLGPHWQLGGFNIKEWLELAPPAGALFCLPLDGGFRGGIRVDEVNFCLPGTLAIGHIMLHDGPIILGYGLGEEYRAGYTPEQVALAYWNHYLRPMAEAYPRVDVWAYFNEFEHDGDFDAGTQYTWYATICAHLCRWLYEQYGKRSAMGSLATHRPDRAQFPNWETWYTPILDACQRYGGYWARHGYDYAMPDEDGSLRYRDDIRRFAKIGYPNINVIVTECGNDWPPVKKRCSLQDYANGYCATLEMKLREDNHGSVGRF
jgi:hypothetical protein